MKGLHYANLSTQKLSEKLKGSSFAWPVLVAGDTIEEKLRFCERLEGVNQLKDVTIVDFYAAVSRIDLRPEGGTFRLKIGPAANPSVENTNLTVELAFGAPASDWQTALDNLSIVGAGQTYGAATVTLDNGTYVIEFEGETAAVPIAEASNELTPASILRVIASERDGVWRHACRLIEAPVAFTTESERRLPKAPYIERYRAGSSADGAELNEIQILVVPPEFQGAAVIDRAGVESTAFSAVTNTERFQEILDPLADSGGSFVLDDVQAGELWIEFADEMGEQAQDLMTVRQVRAPAGDLHFVLDLDAPAVYELLREEDNVDVYLHFKVLYEDETDDTEIRTWSYLQKVKLVRGAHWTGLDVDAVVDLLKKPADSIVPITDGQIITGNQHYEAALPTSGQLGTTSFTFNHNLDEDLGHFVLAENLLPGARLQEHVDYTIAPQSEDSFTLTLLAGGYFAAPITESNGGTWEFVRTGQANVTAQGFLKLAYTTIGPKSAFQAHTHAIGDVLLLADKLADLFSRVTTLENTFPTDRKRSDADADAYARSRAVPAFGGVYPLFPDQFASIGFVAGSRIPDLDQTLLPAFPDDLYAAVHDATISTLPTSGSGSSIRPGDAAVATVGEVYQNQSGSVLTLPVTDVNGDAWKLPANGYAATNGVRWYPVEKYADAESSFYPAHLVRELWRETVSAEELSAGRQYRLRHAVGLAALKANTTVYCHYVIEIANLTADTTPGTPGGNLKEEDWEASPVLTQAIELTATPKEEVFGYRVTRDAAGDLTADKWLYGSWSTADAPDTARFAIRARLIRFDTVNSVTNPVGLIAYSGPRFEEGPTSTVGADVGFSQID